MNKQQQRELFKNLLTLHELECLNQGAYSDDVSIVRAQLQKYETERYRRALIRSRKKRFLLGEQPTKRSLDDERRNALSKEIIEINKDGLIFTDATEIIKSFHHFYKNIFGTVIPTKKKTEIEQLLAQIPKLDREDRNLIEGPITLNEIKVAIKFLPNGKTPGPDGLSGEFYKKFKDIISPVLLAVFEEFYVQKTLPLHFTVDTVLLPKTKDPEMLKNMENYRPISLCNVDYKIYAKVLNERLQCVIEKLVGEHQTCGIRGRAIQTNIHVARSVL